LLLSEVYHRFENEKRILGFSEHTFKAYTIQLNLLIRHFGDKEIHELSLDDLKSYLAKEAERLKPSSIGHRVRFIRSIFRFAHEEGYTDTFIAAKLREPKDGQRVPKYIPEDDLERLREACQTPREKALICLLYATGCRIGEIHLMNRNDIDWENRSIVVLGKGDKQREVYFDAKSYMWIKEYLQTRIDEESSLFVTERKPYKRSTIWSLRYVVKRIAKHADVDINIYPHRFRHTFCQHMIDRGAPMEAVSDLAGHARISTTKIYASLRGEQRKAVYRKYF
jgi:site-specific recombinase XerD